MSVVTQINEKPIMEELAAASKAPGAPFVDALAEPSDTVLKGRGGGDYKIYTEIARDDQVKATVDQRKLAVVSAEWSVDAGGEDAASQKAADFMREHLQNIGLDRVTRNMLSGVFYGYAVSECMWAYDGKLIVPQQVLVRQHTRFRYDGARRLRLINGRDPAGELMPERKFWHYCTGAEHDDEPYGLGLGHWLYWPVYFKRQGLAAWLTFLDKLAIPTAHGKYDPGATVEEKATLMRALAALRSSSSLITPKGIEVQLLEAARSATPDYDTLLDKMDAAISKIVVGQTMTTDDGSSQSQAEVHQEVRGDLVKADADLICESWNLGPALWLTEWNFPGAKPPRLYRHTEEPEDLDTLAKRDASIVQMGYRPTLEYIQDRYGDGWELAPAQQPVNPPATPGAAVPPQAGADPADLADAKRDTVDELADQVDQAAAGKIELQIDAARKLLDDCKDLPEFAERLIVLYPDAPPADLGALIHQAVTLANLQGRDEFKAGA
jgi:phage gp29-like protein